ncbi:trypsin epsilon-like [Convolutriloba macropyga]|uniref:trypsin epsilon-like n=1 Tax=Convolutriloba macropyga TaxID=536237 RepID=UPI003F51ECCC
MSTLIVYVILSGVSILVLTTSAVIKRNNLAQLIHKERVSGGSSIYDETSNFMAYIKIFDSPEKPGHHYICYGALYKSAFVLTVRSLVENVEAKDIKVSIGSTLDETRKHGVSQDLDVIHKHIYNPNSSIYDYDFAILVLDCDQISREENFESVHLPDHNFITPGTLAQVFGWGRLDYDSYKVASFLQSAQVEIVANEECLNVIKDNKYNAGFLCTTGDNGVGSCLGDFGVPLILSKSLSSQSNHPVLIGLFSHSPACKRSSYLERYSNITYYKTWIEQTVLKYPNICPDPSNMRKKL